MRVLHCVCVFTGCSPTCGVCAQIFPSSVRYGKLWYIVLWLGGLLFAVLLFAGVAVHHKAQTACLVLAFVDL